MPPAVCWSVFKFRLKIRQEAVSETLRQSTQHAGRNLYLHYARIFAFRFINLTFQAKQTVSGRTSKTDCPTGTFRQSTDLFHGVAVALT